MIKKLIIENFQSHEKTELNLDPGVNIITGVSQSGKTAILRALYWLLHNRPSGDRIRSNFASGATKVMVETSEGDQIWHVKDDKVNSYTIGSEIFDKIGRDIPDMVQRALRISELNVQKQLDKPFLVTSSAGEVAKTINRITRLEMVDNWVTDLTQTINSTNREKERLEAEIEASGIKIKEYRILADLQPLLDRANKIMGIQSELVQKHNDIEVLVKYIDDASGNFIKFSSIETSLHSLIQTYDQIQVEIEKRSERAEVARSTLKAYQTTQRLKSASELIDTACGIEERKASLSQKSGIITSCQNYFNFWQKAVEVSNLYKGKLQDALKEYQVCPTCLQPITQTVVKKLMGEI
jgi:DNA repair protein SbcC/Rad50